MEYIYGTIQREGVTVENLKTAGSEHSDLAGYITTEREYDGTVITDRCRVLERYHTAESGGLCYDWYLIDNHYRYVKDIVIAVQEAQNAANLDYVCMMTGIDLPNAEGGVSDG